SGGEQQRVALARVLVLRPQLILMDEPLSNLDAKLRLHMRTEIRRIQQELKLTCLYVTHDQKEALTMSDRIMVMNKGKIEQIGTPMHLYDDPATPFVADFIGQANLFYGTLVSVEDKYGLVDVAGRRVKARMGVLNPPRIGGKALLIVRPENLNIGTSENCLAVKLINRLFEGDRIDYQFEVVNGINPKPYSMSVPFLPGTSLLPEGSTLDASFVPDAGVLLNGE
ncbi:MAG TPA: polyamine ABC transporter ATP-binding protein, partial [Parasutterella excrementihominis]